MQFPIVSLDDRDAINEVLVCRDMQITAAMQSDSKRPVAAQEDEHTENELAEFAHGLIEGKISQFMTPWVAKRVQEVLSDATQDPTETFVLSEAAALLIAEIARRKRLKQTTAPA